jgi:pilus assembly protein CpaD
MSIKISILAPKSHHLQQSSLARLALVFVIGAGLSACQSMSSLYDNTLPTHYDNRHKITVKKGDVTLKLRLKRNARQFSKNEIAEIEDFLDEYKNSSSSSLVISRPVGSANELTAASAVAHIKRMMPQAGVSSKSAIAKTYRARSYKKNAPIYITFKRHYASVSGCGDWSRNLATTYDNKNYINFGCAQSHNLAAMIANPDDLVRPRAMDPSDASRRDIIIGKYRKGEPTGSKRTAEETGSVSKVAK